MLKAIREAKMHTSWLNPSEEHEQAMRHFIETILSPDNTDFLDDFTQFQRRITELGIYNSLAQLTMKIAAPGVPDFYQGTEIWDFSLVDPDNRRPVDYALRRRLLCGLDASVGARGQATVVDDLMGNICDHRLKLFTVAMLLRFRRSWRELFDHGAYKPVAVDGPRQAHIFAFTRSYAGREVIVAVPRLLAALLPDEGMAPLGERVWGDTTLVLPTPAADGYRNVLTDRCVSLTRTEDQVTIRAADVFEQFPVALLAGR
jgi:(1->4)-alpha-D-glucan 1-alpha-D-glucosylmutase